MKLIKAYGEKQTQSGIWNYDQLWGDHVIPSSSSVLCVLMSSILPKALIMAQWNQDYSLTASSKRHLGIWITKVKDSAAINVSPRWVRRVLTGAADRIRALQCAAGCHNPLLGVPVFSSQMTLSRSANTTRNLDVAAMYRNWPAPMAGKKDKWGAPEWRQSRLSHCRPLNTWPGRDTTADLARMCV